LGREVETVPKDQCRSREREGAARAGHVEPISDNAEARGIASSMSSSTDAEGPKGCAVPQRADVEGFGADGEARRASAVL